MNANPIRGQKGERNKSQISNIDKDKQSTESTVESTITTVNDSITLGNH